MQIPQFEFFANIDNYELFVYMGGSAEAGEFISISNEKRMETLNFLEKLIFKNYPTIFNLRVTLSRY